MDEIPQPAPAETGATPSPDPPAPAPPVAEAPPPRRAGPPFGVQVIVALVLLRPLVEARGVWHAFSPDSTLASRLEPLIPPETLPFLALAAVATATLILAIGLWRDARWAWSLTIIGTGFFLTRDLYLYATAVPPAVEATPWRAWVEGLPLYASMLLDTVIVVYFNQRDVRRALGLEQARQAEGAR